MVPKSAALSPADVSLLLELQLKVQANGSTVYDEQSKVGNRALTCEVSGWVDGSVSRSNRLSGGAK